MTQTQSSCPPRNKKKPWVILVAALFSMVIVVFWAMQHRGLSVVAWLGAGYALLCTAFLFAQMAAFLRAHTEYDDSVEAPKFDILLLEDDE